MTYRIKVIKIARKLFKTLFYVFFSLLIVAIILFIYFNLPVKMPSEKVPLGVTFSARYAREIGLDPRAVLMAILDDLGVKLLRIPVYWDDVEKEKDVYDFSDIEWQLAEAERARAKVILVIGQKVPRWPECFIPSWIGEDKGKRYSELIELIQYVVQKYRSNNTITHWQVENEPFLLFGECPSPDPVLLDLEIATVRSIDGNRPIIVTDSGELSLWIPAARRADVFGTTLYRTVVTHRFGGIKMDYPIGPNFFKFKKWLTKRFTKQERFFICELQCEPWLEGWTTDQPLEKQLSAMNAKKLRDNVEFARKTGMSPIYLWGAEWWYWLKDKHNQAELWDEAKKIFDEMKTSK